MSTRHRTLTPSQDDAIQLPIETFLESFSEGAALIRPNGTVVHMNTRLIEMIGSTPPRICYEALAGRSSVCPICPFKTLSVGESGPILDKIHVRWGRMCSVSLRFLPGDRKNGLILETVRDLAAGEQSSEVRDQSKEPLSPLLRKLGGLLLISRSLMGSVPLSEKIPNVLAHVISSLSDGGTVSTWAELDEALYGARPDEIEEPLFDRKIEVEGKARGRLSTMFSPPRAFLPEEEYFLEETADLIGRQVEIADLEAMLRQSEEKTKRLAANLRKEMWYRTYALEKETGNLEAILRSSEDMIITTDLEQRVVQFNPGAEAMLGYTAEEWQGRQAGEMWVDPSERERIMREVTETGGIRNYETRLRAKDGTVREISLTLSLLKDEQGKIMGTVGVSKDIGREKAFMRELERLNHDYMEAVHFINHETKNSLIVIAGFVRRLMDTETDPARKDQLKIVYQHSVFLEAMSKDFLVMAELEHGQSTIRKERIENFHEEVILPAMIGLKERYPDSFKSYDESMGGVGAITLMGDRDMLQVVYRNLFGNALKYGFPGAKVAYGVVNEGHHYLFNVWNEGPGVAQGQVEKIFEKFYRVRDESTRNKRGTGLGLYNIRRIIEAHGGKIWCDTKPGKWINFLFRLPKE